MDPRTAATLASIQQQMATGPADQVVTTPDGTRMRVRRAPGPGVVATVESLETHAPVSAVIWEPAETPPAGYPAGLPFLPGRATTYSSTNGNENLQWHQVTAEEAERVAAELRRDGWAETTLPDASMPGVRIRPFLREARQRILIQGGGALSLLETRAE
ncbi:MAG TPA: hypothetical protein VFI13_12525 [Gemmatimonadales bacterium]|nr:hypothetical protein [Gemmatimonadales bacterium]